MESLQLPLRRITCETSNHVSEEWNQRNSAGNDEPRAKVITNNGEANKERQDGGDEELREKLSEVAVEVINSTSQKERSTCTTPREESVKIASNDPVKGAVTKF